MLRGGQYLEAGFEQNAQGTECPGHQSRQIVSGDILHYLATEAQDLSPSIDHSGAEYEVTGRPGVGPTRS